MWNIARCNRLVANLLATCFWFSAAITPALAELYVLGDSLSDVGALSITYTNPVSTSPYVNGKVWTQYLGNSISTFCNDPHQCPLNGKTFYYTNPGNNYAVGGAGITFDSPDAKAPTSYTSLHSQVAALLNSHRLQGGDIVAVWIGANDVLSAGRNVSSSISKVNSAIHVFQSEMAILVSNANGARVYIFTLPDLGKTPLGFSSSDGGKLLTDLTMQFNQGISASLASNVYVIDSGAVFSQLRSLMATSVIFCRKIIDPNHDCGNASNPLSPGIPPQANVLFSDPLHPSIAAHQFIANQLKWF